MLKHILYLIIISSICCFTNNILAQSAPGLLGRKLTIAYDFNPYLGLTSPDQEVSEAIGEEVGLFNQYIASKHTIGADYILTRNISIGADFTFGSRQLNYNQLSSTQYLRHDLLTREYGIRLKYFPIKGAGSIAPIGPYFQFRGMYYNYRSELSFPNDDSENPITIIYDEGGAFSGSFGLGRQGVLFGNILYNIGCEMAIMIPNAGFDATAEVSRNLRNALFFGNLFKFKVGIAVPIF